MSEAGRTARHPSIETAALAAGFSTTLHRAGLPVSPDRAARLAEALRLVPPTDRAALYWACRVVFVSQQQHLALFDAVFSAVFDGRLDPAGSRGDPNAPPAIGSEPQIKAAAPTSRATDSPEPNTAPTPPAPLPGADDSGENDGPERDAILAMASRDEHLHEIAFADLAPDELARLRRLVARIVLSTPSRLSRRTHPSPHRRDRLDVARTVRAAQRTGGDPITLHYSHRRVSPRRLVLLCDVSGSMEPYTRVFLSLLQGAASGARAEAFVFSTHLTRLTRQLALRDPDQALAQAAATATDWAGGTRLAESIRRFIDDFGRRGLARGAVIVVFSDGWAQDDPADVDAQMARLRRLAHRIVWVNPRKVAVDYRPIVGGMAAALPYCDAFVSGHSYAALAEVAAAIRGPSTATIAHQPHNMTPGTTPNSTQ
ncbi:VWA domain-containing protein [Cryobacterium sp. PH29-G1]|uniref:vWA domain-containing protein n=1 Tax=Cryobacterium sp. PH29-G1 TaxID=3046211 RepID=UPI0024B8CE48|nr:VWA domain-containing protein [Cryobacterium sp. PH29-G1]MDJ0349062.1 VWA domain-containing protein [Cryobacterium sp. PH29-G1]